jgi:phage head maturation protease
MTMSDVEVRTLGTLESRGDSRTVGGRAFTFGALSADLGGFFETIAPSFVGRTRSENFAHMICRYGHDSNVVLGSVANGTLRCAADSQGLDYSVDIPTYHDWVLASIRRGDIRHSSFSFRLPSGGDGDQWSYVNGKPLRTLVDGDILETAPVDIPAYPQGTSVALRSLAEAKHADPAEVQRYAQSGELGRLFVRSDRPAPAAVSERSALVDSLAQQFPEVRFAGKNGKDALRETMAASPAAIAARSKKRLLETMAENPIAAASRITPWEARRQLTLMATPPVIVMEEVSVQEAAARAELDALRREPAEARAEVTRPPRRMSGSEAMRVLDSMKPVETRSSALRAYDAYLYDS